MQEQKAQGTAHPYDRRQAQSKHNRARPETNRMNGGIGGERRERCIQPLGTGGCFPRSGLIGEKAFYKERMA